MSTSRVNGLCEALLMGQIVSSPISASGHGAQSLAFQLKTTERWDSVTHTEYHYIVVTQEKIASYVRERCPIGTLLLIRGNLRHNSHNRRMDVLVRELRRLS